MILFNLVRQVISIIYTIILHKSVRRRSQTAGRNSCPIVSGDVSNLSYPPEVHPVTSSRQSVSVRPRHFLYAKNFQIIGELGWLTRVVYFNDPATGYEWGAPMNASGAGDHGWVRMNSDRLCGGR